MGVCGEVLMIGSCCRQAVRNTEGGGWQSRPSLLPQASLPPASRAAHGTVRQNQTFRAENRPTLTQPRYILLAPFSTKGSLLRSTCPRRFNSVALGVRLASRTMQQALPSPQQQMAAMKAKQAALTAPQKEEAKVKVRVVLQEAQAKFQQYLSTAAYYGLVPLALTVGTWTNNLELRDLLSGVRLPLLD